jgi:hypothetical protein
MIINNLYALSIVVFALPAAVNASRSSDPSSQLIFEVFASEDASSSSDSFHESSSQLTFEVFAAVDVSPLSEKFS